MCAVVIYEKKNNNAFITINRPEVYNALNNEAKHELYLAIKDYSKDDNLRCAVVTGMGKNAFCAGQDFNESHDIPPNKAKEWVESFQPFYDEIRALEKPIICVVNGVCAGSGFQLPLLCDIRLATPNARFGMTEIDAGFPTITGSSLLWTNLGRSLTVDLSLTGRLMSAEEALQHGLISKIIPWEHLEEEVNAYCEMLSSKPPTAIKTMKKWFNMLDEAQYRASFYYAADAHSIGYASGEPKIWQERFIAKHKARKQKAEQ